MLISILIPVFNEEHTIRNILKQIDELDILKNNQNLKKEIIVIDDKSYDNTNKILEENSELYTKLLKNSKNSGKGYCIKKGLEVAKGDYVIIQDADVEYEPDDINKLLKIAVDENKDFVIGYRKMKTSIKHPYFYFREIAVDALTLTMNILYNTKIKDCACCYRLFDSKLWKSIEGRSNKFEYDFSIICQAIKRTKKIGQCEVFYNSRSYAEGKKCTWDVGIQAFKRILLDRF